MSWDWQDLASLGAPARRQVIDTLTAQLNGGKIPADSVQQVRNTIAMLRRTLDADTPAKPAATTAPARVRQAPTLGPVTRRATDIGDLYEPATHARQEPGRIVVQLIDTVELTNQHSGRHKMVTHTIEARWTAMVVDVVTAWAIDPIEGSVDLTVWHLRDRVKARGQCPDWDAARYPLKGAVDGLVRAGVLPDDGPGYLRGAHLVEPVLCNVEGLILVVTPARPLPAFPAPPAPPSLTVPHRQEPTP